MAWEEILTAILPILASGGAGWFFGRKKTNADAVTVELENVTKAIEIWQKVAEDINLKYTQLLAEHTQLTDTHRQILTKLQTMQGENEALRQQIEQLRIQLSKIN